MSVQQPSDKRFVTVSEMAELCQLSRSRFYDLIEAGVFPKPVLHPSSKRPMYDRGLQEKCLEIRATGIGANAVPVLFNRKPRKGGQAKTKRKPGAVPQGDHAEILEALKTGFDLTPTVQAVTEALAAEFPNGHSELDPGDVAGVVSRYLLRKKK